MFAELADGSQIRQLHLEVTTIHGNTLVGSLVGKTRQGHNIRVSSSSANFDKVSGFRYVGGLVGHGDGITVISSAVSGNKVESSHANSKKKTPSYDSRSNSRGQGALVRSSEVHLRNLSGSTRIGGLIGEGKAADVYSSSAVVGEINGERYVGGLIGWSTALLSEARSSGLTEVVASYSIVDRIYSKGRPSADPDSTVGGLIGMLKLV